LERSKFSPAEIAEIEAKYRLANRLLYEGTETATVRSESPGKANKWYSQKYLYETDPVIRERVDNPNDPNHIPAVNRIQLTQENPGRNVDEAVSRMWGGLPRVVNQVNLTDSVNQSLGPTEQGVRDRLLRQGMEGTRIRKFIIDWS
jgi:hypothetical protein